jgi:tetratricopeptide (TPR) repeat protein
MVENGRMATALEHAIANQTRMPYYERYHTIASYEFNIPNDYAKAIDAYERILERYPDDVRALNNLAYVHEFRHEYAVEESLAVRAVAVDSTIPILHMAVSGARLLRGDFEGARRELDWVEARDPGYHNAEIAEIYLAAARQEWDSAERRARARLAVTTPDDSLDGLETMAGIVLARGRIGEGERYSQRVLELGARLGSPGRFLSSALRIARLQLEYRHDSIAALRTIRQALDRFPLDSVEEGDRPYDELARFFAAAGDQARAHELITEAEQTHLGALRGLTPNRRWSLGVIALADGRLPEAESDLRHAAASSECSICVLPDLARAYEEEERPDSAIAAYEKYLSTPWKWRFESDAIELGWTMLHLGELYEQRGDTAKAANVYTDLLRLWRRADGDLQPSVAEVHRRLATIEGAAAGRRD